MTFTSGQRTVSGFTPAKDTNVKSTKSAPAKEVERLRVSDPDSSGASGDVFKTPARTASAADLARRGSEGAFETPSGSGMVKNLSTADLTKSEAKLLKFVQIACMKHWRLEHLIICML